MVRASHAQLIYDEAEQQVFLVLEYVDGGPSQERGPDGPVPLTEPTIKSHLRHFCLGIE